MKHILFILVISLMLITACTTTNVSDDDASLADDSDAEGTDEVQDDSDAEGTDEVQEDNVSEDDILPELVDPDDEVNIGNMI